jgi:glutaredoxin
MKVKVYSQKHCKYCDNVKDALKENNIEFENIEIDDNRDEWNEITRIIGIGMTPTIEFNDEIWVPSRDFRGPEDLLKRIEYYKEYPLPKATNDEKIEMLLNANKNLAMSLQQINMTLANMQNKINQLVNPQPKPTPTPPMSDKVEEETTN